MTSPLDPCPRQEVLERLLRDELSWTDTRSLEEHVAVCPACQRALQRLVGSLPDSVVPRSDPDDATADLEPPVVPGCALLDRIDAGRMGVVWRVRDLEFGRTLAVKVMKAGNCANPRAARRFLAEARITGRLAHPSIVPVHTKGAAPRRPGLLHDETGRGRNARGTVADPTGPADRQPELVRIFAQVCQAVAYAHAQGIIHRDLKPANVMVGAFGEVQVMDWGLAKEVRNPERRAKTRTRLPLFRALGSALRTRRGRTRAR